MTEKTKSFNDCLANYLDIMDVTGQEIELDKASLFLAEAFKICEGEHRKLVLEKFETELLPACITSKKYHLPIDFLKRVIFVIGEDFECLYLTIMKVIIAFMGEGKITPRYCAEVEDLFKSSSTIEVIGDYYRSLKTKNK